MKTPKTKMPSEPAVASRDGLAGVELIKAERIRQISKEGWTLKHDRQHRSGEIVEAAIDCLHSYMCGPGGFYPTPADDQWGLGRKHNKKPKRLLAIAGALIAAEIDRKTRRKPANS